MPRVAIRVFRRWCPGLLLLLSGLAPFGIGAQEQREEPASVAGGSALDRAGVSTGLGEGALSRAYPEAAVWLELEEGGRALGLFFPERKLPAEGALLILADVGESAASGHAGNLGQHLADKGWATLTLGLRSPSSALQHLMETSPQDSPASGEDAGEASSVMIDVMKEPELDGPQARYRARIRQTLEAALAELSDRGYERPALVGVGRAVNHLVGLVREGAGLRAVIWVAPAFYPADERSLADRLGESTLPPILELNDALASDRDPSERRAARLRRAGIADYQRQPVTLQGPPSATGSQALANRIDAWLRSL